MAINPQKLSVLPRMSGGWPTALSQLTLSLFFVLDNSLPSEMLCVWKFFSYPRLDCLNKGDTVSKSGLVRFPGGGNGSQFQCSYLEKLMDRGTWQTSIHGNHKDLDTNELLSAQT